MKVTKGFLGLFLLGILFNAEAQKSNEREKWVSSFEQPFILDSLTIVPGSIHLSDTTIRGDILYSTKTGTITIKTNQPVDSVLVKYKIFPYAMHGTVYHKSLDLYDSSAHFKPNAGNKDIYFNEKRSGCLQ